MFIYEYVHLYIYVYTRTTSTGILQDVARGGGGFDGTILLPRHNMYVCIHICISKLSSRKYICKHMYIYIYINLHMYMYICITPNNKHRSITRRGARRWRTRWPRRARLSSTLTASLPLQRYHFFPEGVIPQVKNNYASKMRSGSEEGSYSRRVSLNSRLESNKEEEEGVGWRIRWPRRALLSSTTSPDRSSK